MTTQGYQTTRFVKTFVLLMGFTFFVSQAESEVLKASAIDKSNAVNTVTLPQFNERERVWLQSHKKITIATSQYPPLTFLDDAGSMAGISADYLRLISERTGITFEIKLLPWPELMAQAKSREIDLFSGLKNPDRDEFLNFTSPYLDVSYVVINRVSGPYLRSFSNLNGQKVAVVNNWTIHKLLKNKFPNVVLVPFNSLREALVAVSTSAVEAYVGDMLTASYQIQVNAMNNLKVAGAAPFQEDFVRFAVRKDWPELVQIIEKVIQTIPVNQREAILDKWLQVNFEKTVDWTMVWMWVGGVSVGFLGLIIILMSFWNKRLQHEISQRKQTEIALLESEASMLQAKEDAESANKAKSQFLSSMSHELRTPLNAIIGFSQIIQIRPNIENVKESAQEILNGGYHLLELINDVLKWAQIESVVIEPIVKNYCFNNLLNQSLALIQPIATKHSISIVNNTAQNNDVEVNVDERQFKQVLLNILSNAIKYNKDEGSVIIDCSTNDKNMISLSIMDFGKGLTAQQLQDIFLPFNRAGAESSNIEGTGLGLSITKTLIEKMGGKIKATSEINKGSCFFIQVPLSL
ncbi:MAG: transporter substrate-binding domain-containing protein [Bermanella sp.]